MRHDKSRPAGRPQPFTPATHSIDHHTVIIDLQAERDRRQAVLAVWVRRGAELAITTKAPCTGVCTCWGAPLGGWDQ